VTLVDYNLETNIPGLFALGNVTIMGFNRLGQVRMHWVMDILFFRTLSGLS
jgi:succinate dehydrogenase/fumarate reductase flavoprotein subunit